MPSPLAAARGTLESDFRSGDEDALAAAFREYGSLVHTICRRTLGEARADDVVQEVFVTAWRRRESFDPDRGTLAAWLTTITKSRIIDHVRSEDRHANRRAEDIEADSEAASVGAPDVDVVSDRMLIADALRRLPERARRVLTLHYFDDLTQQEIADKIPLPLGTVKSDLRRSLAVLRTHLEPVNG